MPSKVKPLAREYSYRTLMVLIYKVTTKKKWATVIVDRSGTVWPGCVSDGAQYCNAITNRLIDKKWPELPDGGRAIGVEITTAMRDAIQNERAEYLAREKAAANA